MVAQWERGCKTSGQLLCEDINYSLQILDLLDCTGSGDVDTSKVVQADEEGHITGLYGKKLKVNPDWKNPSGLRHTSQHECKHNLIAISWMHATKDPTETGHEEAFLAIIAHKRLYCCNEGINDHAGLWHVGAKRAFELFPGGLKKRSKQERKKRWEQKQREAVTACTAAVASHKKVQWDVYHHILDVHLLFWVIAEGT